MKDAIHVWSSRHGAATLALACAFAWVMPALAQPIAVQTLGEGVAIEILELKRINPKIVGLTFALVNDTDEAIDPGDFGLRYSNDMSTIILLDLENLKQYTVGSGGARCLCSNAVEVPAGGRVEFWAHYGAPDPDVSSIAIQFAVAPPLYDMPISE
jgi:hypothetical protein